MLLFVLEKCFDAIKVAARIYPLSSPPYILPFGFYKSGDFLLSVTTPLETILNVASREDTTFHIEKTHVAQS